MAEGKGLGQGRTWAINCSSPERTSHRHSHSVGRTRQGLAVPSPQYLKGVRSGNIWQKDANDYYRGPKRREDLWETHRGRRFIGLFGITQGRGTSRVQWAGQAGQESGHSCSVVRPLLWLVLAAHRMVGAWGPANLGTHLLIHLKASVFPPRPSQGANSGNSS